MKEPPLISFITINYNGLRDTSELIKSMQQHITSINYEIIIVDNASTKNEAFILQHKFPTAKVVRSNQNLGFSGGNNLGIKNASGTFLFFINNDTFIKSERGLKTIIEKLQRHPEIGGISPKIKFAACPQNIQYAGFTLLSPITLRNKTIGLAQTDESQFNVSINTPYLHGAAMIVKKEVINKVGFMPEIYFLYYEELDWSLQITRNGYSLWYEPSFTVYHKESQSTSKESKLQIYYLTRNRLLYAWRNLKKGHKWASIIYQIVIAVTKNNIKYVLKGNVSLVFTNYLAIWDFIFLKNKLS